MSRELAVNDELKQTTRIFNRPKITTDELGRNIWDKTVESSNFELVSTEMLSQIIEADDHDTTDQLREVAQGEDGLLAHDVDTDTFEIISEEELQHILDGTNMQADAKTTAGLVDEPVVHDDMGEDELELVSTQMLRQLLSPDDEAGSAERGFDPYNRG